MNARKRADNIWARWCDGRADIVQSIERAIETAYREGVRRGAAHQWNESVNRGVLSAETLDERKEAMRKAFYRTIESCRT